MAKFLTCIPMIGVVAAKCQTGVTEQYQVRMPYAPLLLDALPFLYFAFFYSATLVLTLENKLGERNACWSTQSEC